MSISKKMFLGIAAFIIVFVLTAYGVFVTYMPGFVETFKENEMIDIANLIKEAKAADSDEAVSTIISDLSSASDISVVIEEKGVGMYGSAESRGRGQGQGRSMGSGLGNMLQDANTSEETEFFFAQHHILNTPFMIYKDAEDIDYVIYVMRPVQSVDDVVLVARGFFAILAVLAVVTGLIFSYLYSRKFSDPILKLNDIAKHMAKLDFTHEYAGANSDEIGELGRSINYLSRRLDQALSDLEAELRHTSKLNELQKRFLADASHELKTPLAVIMGNIEQLEEKVEKTPENKRYIHAIINETEHMDHIIKDLLKLSELESERAIMQMAEIDLAALFDDVLFSYSELIKQKDLKLDYDLDDSLPLIADEKNMEIVIRNVIGNAIVHTNQGARIKISSEITGSQCRLEVFNEAEEISDEQLEMIFDRFTKFPNKERAHKTTGLGLSIVKRILDMHGFDFGMSRSQGGVIFHINVLLKKH